MTRTVLSSATKEIVIGFDAPFCVIGERINPTGRKLLAEEMANGNYDGVQSDAIAQIEAGATMLDVNAGIPLANEPKILAESIQLIQSFTDIPLFQMMKPVYQRTQMSDLKLLKKLLKEQLTTELIDRTSL